MKFVVPMGLDDMEMFSTIKDGIHRFFHEFMYLDDPNTRHALEFVAAGMTYSQFNEEAFVNGFVIKMYKKNKAHEFYIWRDNRNHDQNHVHHNG